MSRDPAEILKEVLALPAEARAAIADSLLGSLDKEVDAGAFEAWEREIRRRIAELDGGAVSGISWTDARSRLIASLANER